MPPADDQEISSGEFNDHTDTLTDHAERLDAMGGGAPGDALDLSDLVRASLRWEAGYNNTRTWVLDGNGVPTSFHAATGSTAEQRGATVPGSNSSVWAQTPINSEHDFLAVYNAAKT